MRLVVLDARAPQRSYDVVSVKENTSVSDAGGIGPATPGRLRIANKSLERAACLFDTPLRFILLHACDALDHQLVGAPDWTGSGALRHYRH